MCSKSWKQAALPGVLHRSLEGTAEQRKGAEAKARAGE